MEILTAQFNESGMIVVNDEMYVPDTEHDRERWGITAWIADGNTIADYVPIPPSTIPTQDEMVKALWKKSRGESADFDSLNTKVVF